MNNMDVEEKIKKIFSKELEINFDKINLTTSLKEDLNIDSIDMMQLIDILEQEFNIKINFSEINNITIIKDLIFYINNKINKK